MKKNSNEDSDIRRHSRYRVVDADEAGMRLDRWFRLHYSRLAFGQLQKLLRSGQIRVNGGRIKCDTRVALGQSVRIPPMVALLETVKSVSSTPLTLNTIRRYHDIDALRAMTLHEDSKTLVLNKPPGLAVQGGSGINRHIDKMLESMRNKKGERPRLVHRLDRDTSGVLVIAKTRAAAAMLTQSFRQRTAQKIYWAVCKGIPHKKQGGISQYMIKESRKEGDRMRIARHDERGAEPSRSYYRLIERCGQNLGWIEWQPVSGRTHQLRVHATYLGNPIIGDNKYFNIENWNLPGGIQNKLHLHARSMEIPHPLGGILNVVAPLPPHMRQTFNLLGFNETEADKKPFSR